MATDNELTIFTVRCSRHARHFDAYNRTTHSYRADYVHAREWVLELEACTQWLELITPEPPRDLPDAIVEPIDVVVLPTEVAAYEWLVEKKSGTTFTQVGRVRTEVGKAGEKACRATVRVPTDARSRGSFRVTLTVHRTAGKPAVRTRSVEIEEYCIVSMGDSYASGEGNPDQPGTRQIIPGPGDIFDIGRDLISREELASVLNQITCSMSTGPVWQEPLAHRSYFAGHARAVQSFEETRTDASGVMRVRCATYLSFACSGARIANLTSSAQHSWQNGTQIAEARRALSSRPVDALILTIGGNDSGFANTLQSLLRDSLELPHSLLETLFGSRMFGPLWLFYVSLALALSHDNVQARQQVMARARTKMAELKTSYLNLARQVDSELGARVVYLTGYPAGLFDRANGGGSGCGIFDLPVGLEVDAADAALVRDLGVELNRTISQAVDAVNAEASAAGRAARWVFVDGIQEGFAGHGYCDSQRLYWRMSESCRRQGDFDGMMHPNINGHAVYANQIVAKLRQHTAPVAPAELVRIELSASSVSFGTVPIGELRARDVTITNAGGSDLQIEIAASPPSSRFRWSGGKFTLRPGQKLTRTISFEPLGTGAQQATLSVTSNAIGSPHKIVIKGSGLTQVSPDPDRPPVFIP